MGYACPICGTEEIDAVHLANHLAVTASLGRREHVEWLETHVPDWHEMGPEGLADAVADRALEIETPGFESEEGTAPSLEAELAMETRRPGRGATAAESIPEDVLREARELTAEMDRRGEGAGSADGDGAGDASGAETPGTGGSEAADGDETTDAGEGGSADADRETENQ